MSEQVYAYRALCGHGKVRFMAVDRPDVMRDCAEEIADMLRHGLRLERVTVEEARRSDMHCDECDTVQRGKRTDQTELFAKAGAVTTSEVLRPHRRRIE